MRKLQNVILLLLCFHIVLEAQNEVNFTQFMSNQLLVNPGFAGGHEVLVFTGLYRHQWQGLEGAPRIYNVSANMPFFNNRCGAGLSIVSDHFGISRRTYVDLAYAYRIHFSETSKLSIGLQGRIEQTYFDWEEAAPLDMGDEFIPMMAERRFGTNAGFGIYYSHELFFAGFSVPTLMRTTLEQESLDGETVTKSARPTYFTAGISQRLGANVVFKPTALVATNNFAPLELDINLMFVLKEKFWIGTSYRMGDSFHAIFQYQFNQQLKVGLASDFQITELRKTNIGTAEIMVEYRLMYDEEKINNIRFF